MRRGASPDLLKNKTDGLFYQDIIFPICPMEATKSTLSLPNIFFELRGSCSFHKNTDTSAL